MFAQPVPGGQPALFWIIVGMSLMPYRRHGLVLDTYQPDFLGVVITAERELHLEQLSGCFEVMRVEGGDVAGMIDLQVSMFAGAEAREQRSVGRRHRVTHAVFEEGELSIR